MPPDGRRGAVTRREARAAAAPKPSARTAAQRRARSEHRATGRGRKAVRLASTRRRPCGRRRAGPGDNDDCDADDGDDAAAGHEWVIVARLLGGGRRKEIPHRPIPLESVAASGGHMIKTRRQSRREFVGLAGAGIAGFASAAVGNGTTRVEAAADGPDPDLVVFNAKVYTVDAQLPSAEAFAVKSGRFLAVGSDRRHQGAGRQEHPDLRCAADDHRARVHRLPQPRAGRRPCSTKSSSAIRSRSSSSPSTASSTSCARKAQETPPGTWVEGFFFDDTKVKDKRELNVHDLDEVSRIIRSSCSTAAATPCSTTARRSSWRASPRTRPNPPGGTFDKDENGDLNGRVTDRARARASAASARVRPSPPPSARRRDATGSRTSRSSSSGTA